MPHSVIFLHLACWHEGMLSGKGATVQQHPSLEFR